MMLLLKHNGWDVIANGWSAASKGSSVFITYPWPDATMFLGVGVGVAQVELHLTFGRFQAMVTRLNTGDILDLREHCR